MLFQFEDFGNENGRRLLEQYRGETCAFNDDIQGTAAAMLGGIIAAMPLLKGGLGDQTFLFAGAGETGTGMADLLACAISRATRQPLTEARKRIWLFDSKGLVTRERAQNLEARHITCALLRARIACALGLMTHNPPALQRTRRTISCRGRTRAPPAALTCFPR